MIVSIGFTKERCLILGESARINRTSKNYITNYQQVYNLSTYLYFEGNILITIQNQKHFP